MANVYAVEAIQNGKRSDLHLFSSLSEALENIEFVRETAEDDSVKFYWNGSTLPLDDITAHIEDYGFSGWVSIGEVKIKEPGRYTSTYWQHEGDLQGGREGVYFLQILDPEGKVYATILHYTCNGNFPIGGKLANEKLERANTICDALNTTL